MIVVSRDNVKLNRNKKRFNEYWIKSLVEVKILNF